LLGFGTAALGGDPNYTMLLEEESVVVRNTQIVASVRDWDGSPTFSSGEVIPALAV